MSVLPDTGSAADEIHCGFCGTRRDAPCRADCPKTRRLDPPRYCTSCGRRLVVLVDPFGWRARCSRHGETTSRP